MKTVLSFFLFAAPFLLPAQSSSWIHCFPSTNNNLYMFTNALVENGCLIQAVERGNYAGELIKTDSLGNVIWASTIASGVTQFYTKTGLCADGNYYSYSWVIDNFTAEMFYQLQKIDTSGAVLWTRDFINIYAGSYPLALTYPNGDFVLGISLPNRSRLIRANSNGNVIWDKSFTPDTTGIKDRILKMEPTENSGTLVLAHLTSNAGYYLFHVDSIGNLVWYKTFKINTCPITDVFVPSDFVLQNSGNMMLVGRSFNYSMNQYFPAIMQLDGAGNYLSYIILNNSLNYINKIEEFPNGDLLMGLMSMNWEPGLIHANPAGVPVSVSRFNILGQCYDLSFTALPGLGIYFSFEDQDVQQMVYKGVTGKVNCSQLTQLCNAQFLNLSMSPGNCFPLDSIGMIIQNHSDTPISRAWNGSPFSPNVTPWCSLAGTHEIASTWISMYPNPSSGIFNITGLFAGSKIMVYNRLGQEVYRTIRNHPQTEINLSGLEAGIYLVKVNDGTREFAKRLVIIQ